MPSWEAFPRLASTSDQSKVTGSAAVLFGGAWLINAALEPQLERIRVKADQDLPLLLAVAHPHKVEPARKGPRGERDRIATRISREKVSSLESRRTPWRAASFDRRYRAIPSGRS